jgi:hypothetical protein
MKLATLSLAVFQQQLASCQYAILAASPKLDLSIWLAVKVKIFFLSFHSPLA